MGRTKLDAQLHEIRTSILHLGTLVETSLEQAVQAMQPPCESRSRARTGDTARASFARFRLLREPSHRR